ncbi:hypothetical protein QJS10_CPA01g02199 [Acorus calamus]|uniref:NADH dehydrogenase subunit 6 n=1 Tax=Acorus calamus TaxID=4465 RepID=A0AAV9FL26_ACOCL|nr:hypothetical protein QJS10_CPA01g02199 [Acorus calamus]
MLTFVEVGAIILVYLGILLMVAGGRRWAPGVAGARRWSSGVAGVACGRRGSRWSKGVKGVCCFQRERGERERERDG